MFVVSAWASLTVAVVQLKMQKAELTECLKDLNTAASEGRCTILHRISVFKET